MPQSSFNNRPHHRIKHHIELTFEDLSNIDRVLDDVEDLSKAESLTAGKVKQIVGYMKQKYAERHPEPARKV